MQFKKFIKERIMERSVEEFESGERALKHLKEALKELQNADKNKAGFYDDWKYFISKVQEIISSDRRIKCCSKNL